MTDPHKHALTTLQTLAPDLPVRVTYDAGRFAVLWYIPCGAARTLVSGSYEVVRAYLEGLQEGHRIAARAIPA